MDILRIMLREPLDVGAVRLALLQINDAGNAILEYQDTQGRVRSEMFVTGEPRRGRVAA